MIKLLSNVAFQLQHAALQQGKPEFARIPIIQSTFYRPCAIPITNTLYTQRPS